jgi:hypothetical protein
MLDGFRLLGRIRSGARLVQAGVLYFHDGEVSTALFGQGSQTAGGIFPRWRSDSQELYWIGRKGEMMAASIKATATTAEVGEPTALFPTRIFAGGVDNAQGPHYAVAADGRFLINTVLDDSSALITLLQALTELEPGRK